MKVISIFVLVICFTMLSAVFGQEPPAGEKALGSRSYDEYERPETCQACHSDIYQQWRQAMMSQAYTHHWDEIEYFKLAVPHAEKDEMVAGIKAGCNGCHAPISFLAGDVPPPKPAENSRANESVSCEICHSIVDFEADTPFNFNFVSKPGEVKYGSRENVKSPYHQVEKKDIYQKAEFCGTCHNEKSPYGAWVKSTHLEWMEGPYQKEGVVCQDCHMPKGIGRSAKMAEEREIRHHLFHGAHDPGKIAGTIEIRMHPEEREVSFDEPVVIKVQLFNGKTGHKFPTGSVEDRIVWLHLTATDAEGKDYHLKVDPKGFEGEEYTIAADVLAYQDMGIPLDIPDFKGVQRDGVPVGDRIFRKAYLDPQGRMTIMQWNTKSFGPDYRIGPRETKQETFTWELPDEIAPGVVKVQAVLNYQKLVKPVAEFLGVPEEESEVIVVNKGETWFEVYE